VSESWSPRLSGSAAASGGGMGYDNRVVFQHGCPGALALLPWNRIPIIGLRLNLCTL
jgi:hypothetical protein